MTQLSFNIDIENFARMSTESKIAFLEAAILFNALPAENVNSAKDYIEKCHVKIESTHKQKTFLLEGGVHKLADVVKENFPHVVALDSSATVERVEYFVQHNQIDNNDFVACSGSARYSTVRFLLFKDSADAIVAKLFFEDSKLLENTVEVLKQLDMEYDSADSDDSNCCKKISNTSNILKRTYP